MSMAEYLKSLRGRSRNCESDEDIGSGGEEPREDLAVGGEDPAAAPHMMELSGGARRTLCKGPGPHHAAYGVRGHHPHRAEGQPPRGACGPQLKPGKAL